MKALWAASIDCTDDDSTELKAMRRYRIVQEPILQLRSKPNKIAPWVMGDWGTGGFGKVSE